MNPGSPTAVTPQRVVVASTVMLSFISFWRAAAIVLSDLASSAYYAGGIAEQAIGKAAPWFILGIMLFSYAVRAVYIESCSMFVRGGVYRVVHQAMGGTMAKFSVSALMFDYILTGPISAVSAGLYLAGLINETSAHFYHRPELVNPSLFAVVFGIAVTIYFWRQNTIGIHESSQKALRIMQITTVMVVTLIAWCLYTVLAKGFQPVPLPSIANLRLNHESLGWLPGSWATMFPAIAIMVGLGHSLLAMSGEESLAQVNREIAHPKLKNLERAGFIIFIYSLLFTSLVSFFAVMLIPDAERQHALDNLIGALSMNLAGPLPLRMLFHGFVVFVGALILSGAVNTAIIGSNGVLNRVAEDGVLPGWLRVPHHKFGTTYRVINLIVILQLFTIVVSRGDIMVLGEAYAFGVVWSFSMNALSVLVLRYKQPGGREWKVPLNFTVRGREIPVGLGLVTLALFSLAIVNVVTKKVATISGISFTLAFFLVFEVTDILNKRRMKAQHEDASHERFRLDVNEDVTSGTLDVRPGNVLVAVRNPHRLTHLKRVLEKTDTAKVDIVVVSVRRVTGDDLWTTNELFAERETEVFTHVVSVAEKAGRPVKLLVVPGKDAVEALVQTAARLGSARIVVGTSPRQTIAEQGLEVGRQWEKLPAPRPALALEVVPDSDAKSSFVNLGPHPPRLWPEDIELVHELWLDFGSALPHRKLHHRDVVGYALRRLKQESQTEQRDVILKEIRGESDSDAGRAA
ncbi:APC family permease [uncultured Desulfobulbus sp.]|uniref:APC family permease n=1 Tax=uncultured Desulfobulbus sp. TaxID=239745 RepID=UPI0029C9304D|nr:APC family permease [uncultured Desulfobulbus sp.]